jgi:ATP-dependent DNA helicase RecG
LTNALPESEAYKRIAYFSKHHDGFDIAEYDLQMRGPGEVTGYRQSGWEDMKIADILRDAKLFADVQNDIDSVMQHENVL